MDMLRSNSKSLGNHVVSPEEEKERLQREGFAEKEGLASHLLASQRTSILANLSHHIIYTLYGRALPSVLWRC